jgi:hypothetical protein
MQDLAKKTFIDGGQSKNEHDLPKIAGISNLKAGSKGRNFESFTGLMEPQFIKDPPASIQGTTAPVKVLIKLYKQQ